MCHLASLIPRGLEWIHFDRSISGGLCLTRLHFVHAKYGPSNYAQAVPLCMTLWGRFH